jgi:hypothetical protein
MAGVNVSSRFFSIKIVYMKNRLYLAPRIEIKFKNKEAYSHDGMFDKLTPDPDDQATIPTNVRPFNDGQIIEHFMARGTTLPRPDLQSVISAYRDEVGYIV